jgi:hypothetical protein
LVYRKIAGWYLAMEASVLKSNLKQIGISVEKVHFIEV